MLDGNNTTELRTQALYVFLYVFLSQEITFSPLLFKFTDNSFHIDPNVCLQQQFIYDYAHEGRRFMIEKCVVGFFFFILFQINTTVKAKAEVTDTKATSERLSAPLCSSYLERTKVGSHVACIFCSRKRTLLYIHEVQ